MDERLVTSTFNPIEEETENILRPKNLEGYVGQEKLKSMLTVYVKAAHMRGESLDHVLLYGPAGLGKTTLAHIIAGLMGSRIIVSSGPSIEKAADLAAILTNLSQNDVLFIDEIHRISHAVEEILYPAMEDYSLDFIVGKGPSARSIRLPLQKFTLIGATTKIGMLSQPLRDRFGIKSKLEMYSTSELIQIIKNSAQVLNTEVDDVALLELAKRSRGTPRVANRLLKRTRDFSQVFGEGIITSNLTEHALRVMEIDELGLDAVDKQIINAMIDKFNGGPVGVDAIAAASGEDANTIEEVYEPYLMQLGFIARTPRGRICTALAYKHLNKPIPLDKTNILEE